MNKIILSAAIVSTGLFLTGCIEDKPAQPQVKNTQAELAQRAANSIQFTDNAEIDNIKNRVELTSKPGLLGYVVLFNESGQPIMYEGVRGKITSGSKRLTPPDRAQQVSTGGQNGGQHSVVRQAPSDEGTYGSSNPYIFYWNTDGVYRQWSGHYLYSTQPMRLTIQPLVVNIEEKK